MNISGGGGTTSPGGSTTQVQFNDAGAFNGDSGLVFDKSTGKLTIGKQLVISSGAVTSDAPLLNLSQTWNAGAVTFTGVKLNVTDTASNASSLLMDLQVAGSSKFRAYKNGALVVLNNAGVNSSGYIGGWSGGQIGFTNAATWSDSAALDTYLSRDAAGTMALRNSTSAQAFRVYNTYTDAANYERAGLYWSSNVFTIDAQNAGTGGNRGINVTGKASVTVESTLASVILRTSGSNRWSVDPAGQFLAAVDNAVDIGAASASRPRNIYAGTSILATGGSSVIGYGTGAGGAVTQATSRTTGVTINKASGAITLVSDVGSTAWQSFTVTNSTVAATDTVVVSQKSGADLYRIYVTAVSAGSFQLTFATTGGTTTEQPVFNFSVIKAVAS